MSKEEIRNYSELTEQICEALLKNNVYADNIRVFLKECSTILNKEQIESYYSTCAHFAIPLYIARMKERYIDKPGCVLAAPYSNHSGNWLVIYSELSAEEIQKVLKLKAFM